MQVAAVPLAIAALAATAPAAAAVPEMHFIEELPATAYTTFFQSDPASFGVWAGDLNCDGRDDVTVFRPRSASSASVVFGYAAGAANGAQSVADLDGANGFVFGVGSLMGPYANVGRAGDINADGLPDTLWLSSRPSAGSPIAFMLWGKGSRAYNASEAPDAFAMPDATIFTNAHPAGSSLMSFSLGDVNGDHVDDFALQTVPAGDSVPIVISIIFGSRNPWPYQVDISAVSAPQGATLSLGIGYTFGSTIGSGDVNGDGLGDIVVAQAGNDAPGIVYVIFGRAASKPWPPAGLVLPGDIAADPSAGQVYVSSGSTGLGSVVASGGDFNGDGLDDLILVDSAADGGVGRLYVVYGTASVITGSVDVTNLTSAQGFFFSPLDGPEAGASGEFLRSADFIGDVNGDGTADIVARGTATELYVLLGAHAPPSKYGLRGAAVGTPGIYRQELSGSTGFILTFSPNDSWSFVLPYGNDAKKRDFDGDGNADFLLSISNGTTWVVFGGQIPRSSPTPTPTATSTSSASASASATATSTHSATATATATSSATTTASGTASATASASASATVTASPSSSPAAAEQPSKAGFHWGTAEIAGVSAGGAVVLLASVALLALGVCGGKRALSCKCRAARAEPSRPLLEPPHRPAASFYSYRSFDPRAF